MCFQPLTGRQVSYIEQVKIRASENVPVCRLEGPVMERSQQGEVTTASGNMLELEHVKHFLRTVGNIWKRRRYASHYIFYPTSFFFLIRCAPIPTTDLVPSTETRHHLSLSSFTAHHNLLSANLDFSSSLLKCSFRIMHTINYQVIDFTDSGHLCISNHVASSRTCWNMITSNIKEQNFTKIINFRSFSSYVRFSYYSGIWISSWWCEGWIGEWIKATWN